MTIESTDQIYELATIREEYIHNGRLAADDHDTHGWVRGTITDFRIDEEGGKLDVVIQLPWDEIHYYGYDLDNISTNNFRKFCKCYDKKVSEFESIVGEGIWLKVRYLKIDDDGEIKSGSRLNYRKIRTGPNYWINKLKWVFIVMVLFIAGVLLI